MSQRESATQETQVRNCRALLRDLLHEAEVLQRYDENLEASRVYGFAKRLREALDD